MVVGLLLRSVRVFRQFVWLEVGAGKVAFSRPAHQRVTQAVGRIYRGVTSLSWFIVAKARQGTIVILTAILLAACETVAPLPKGVSTPNATFPSGNSLPTSQVTTQPTIRPQVETPFTPVSIPAVSIRLYHNHIATRTIRDQYSFSVIVFDENSDVIPKSIQIIERESNLVVGQYELSNENEIKSLCSSTHPDLEIFETSLTDYHNFPQGFIVRIYEGDFLFRITIEALSGTPEVIEMTTPHGVCLSEVQ
jgi:hypothetical protein